MTSKFDPLLGDLREMAGARSRVWYGLQVAAVVVVACTDDRRLGAAIVGVALSLQP